MIPLLKFGASWILPPGIFILALIIVSLYAWRKNQKRIAAVLATVTLVFYLASTTFVGGALIRSLEDVYSPPEQLPAGDVIVVLGGGATNDTPDVSGTGGLTSVPANRLLTAVRLQKKLDIPILLSGGEIYADSGKEADIAQRILLDLGVPAKDIIIENKSLTTTQNAKYSAKIIREKHFRNIILVTSAFHMERAMENFRKEGIDPIPYPADYTVNKQANVHLTKLMPSSQALEFTALYCQEKLRYFITRYLE